MPLPDIPHLIRDLFWLCPHYVLHGVPQRLMKTRFDIHPPSVTFQHPAPTQIIPEVMGHHAMDVVTSIIKITGNIFTPYCQPYVQLSCPALALTVMTCSLMALGITKNLHMVIRYATELY